MAVIDHFADPVATLAILWRLTFRSDDPILKMHGRDKNMYRSPSTDDPHRVAYVAVRVKAAKRPSRPKKRDAERVRNRPVNYELGRS